MAQLTYLQLMSTRKLQFWECVLLVVVGNVERTSSKQLCRSAGLLIGKITGIVERSPVLLTGLYLCVFIFIRKPDLEKETGLSAVSLLRCV